MLLTVDQTTNARRLRELPYERAARRLLPGGERALLLAACLRDAQAAALAWDGFCALAGDTRAYFERDQTGLQSLAPFIAAGLARNGIDAGKSFKAYADAASLQVQQHNVKYRDALGEVVDVLARARVSAMLMKAAAVSALASAPPAVRQDDAIDLLVHPNQMQRALEALQAAGLTPALAGAGAMWHRNIRHHSGLPVRLHSRPLFLPHFELNAAEVRHRRQKVHLRERELLVMSPADGLVHLCGHAVYARGRANLRWLCDVYELLPDNPALDWRQLVDTTCRARLALPVLVVLSWMKDFLGAAIPLGYLTELRAACEQPDSTVAEGLCASEWRLGLVRKPLQVLSRDPRYAWALLRFQLLPSVRYVRWLYDVDGAWPIAQAYASRLYGSAVRALAARKTETRVAEKTPLADQIIL